MADLSSRAENILVTAIQASPSRSLNASTDMRELYLQHAGLQAFMRTTTLKAFCGACSMLSWKNGTIQLSQPCRVAHTGQEIKKLVKQPACSNPTKNAKTEMKETFQREMIRFTEEHHRTSSQSALMQEYNEFGKHIRSVACLASHRSERRSEIQQGNKTKDYAPRAISEKSTRGSHGHGQSYEVPACRVTMQKIHGYGACQDGPQDSPQGCWGIFLLGGLAALSCFTGC